MNDKIKVKFWRFDNLVVMRVLDMPERYREKWLLDSDNEYKIQSIAYPSLNHCILSLQGSNRAQDDNYSSYKYKTAEDAKAAIDAFSRMIRKFNEEDCECPDEGIEPEVTTAE